MSDKEWYEGLTGKDMAGKHVHVVFKTGTVVDGRLEWDGLMYVSHARQIAVLGPAKGGSWELSPGVESVSLVWDERDWEQIRTEDISKADAIVVNGRLLQVSRVVHDAFLVGECDPVPVSFVSRALRRRHKLPTEPGYYRDGDGDIWIHRSGIWYRPLDTHYLIKVPLSEVHFPLTPVHFVDGRAE